jgi:hypothetical protein
MADRFELFPPLLDSPYFDGFEVTPSDSTVFSQPTRAIYVGSTGNLKLDLIGYDGTPKTLTFNGVVAGSLLKFRVVKVYSSDTTAGGIVGLY